MPHARPRGRTEFWRALRYLVSAGSVALLYLGLLAVGLWIGWHYLFAILVAQLITIAVAFPVYRTFVFQSRGPVLKDFLRFLSVWATGAVAGVVVTPALVELAHLHPLVAQVIAVVVVSVGSFLAHRLFSFRSAGVTPSTSDLETTPEAQP